MTKMEIENKIADFQSEIEKRLGKLFSSVHRGGKKIYLLNETETASIVCVRLNEEDPFFVVEYGSGEDGDRFYPSDYQNHDDLISAILEEIQEEAGG